ncbi:arginine-ornithine antiporter [Lentilactobacillus senioris]|uniref:arginine-ornithine antiporter n=1 Tax=Lentilactobacillus senioris TaxID=931534 RepID=UPI00227FC29E|nr:arginine-ornithine antiporter [Lentilactobacillus senioris]MCY9805967.1 arginine-ornithine antiporter [Lentilactobacillus senioris]
MNKDELTGNVNGISLPSLIAMVITSAIGAGIFALTSDLAVGASPGPALIAWGIVGFGILMLALSLNNLVLERPELEGIFAYAQEGFGDFAGFISGWGYWLSTWLGNVAFATVMMSAIGYFVPAFKSGQSVIAIVCASIVSWTLTWFVSRGVENAAFLNAIITICKLIPLFTFIVIAIFLFKSQIFTAHFWNNVSGNFNGGKGVGDQIKNCMMVMMWVFVGVEGAVNLSSRAKRKSDAGKATIIGLLCLILIYVLASILPYGYMSRTELMNLDQPAMVYIFKDMVGTWGGAFISIGLIISLFGSWISWTMLPAETMRLMADEGLLPKFFARENKYKAPYIALIVTAGLVQLFLISLLFMDSAYNFAYSLCTAAVVISYIFVGAYQMKFAWLKQQKGQVLIGFLALAFQCVGIYLAGLQYVLLCLIAYVPGIWFFVKARKEKHHDRVLFPYEWILTALISLGAIIGIMLLLMNKISV